MAVVIRRLLRDGCNPKGGGGNGKQDVRLYR